MPIPQSIQRLGFRKWYERELLAGHSHLLLVVLCGLAAAGAIEAFWSASGEGRLLMVGSVLVAAAIGNWALRRYLFLLMRAEFIADQAVCSACEAYGRWVVESQIPADEAEGRTAQMRVCCRKCQARWTINC